MNKLRHLGTALLLLLILFTTISVRAQGTAFTYQGRLNAGNAPANGNYDLIFTLFGTNAGGSAVAGPVTNSATFVTNGLFTVLIDFGLGAFTGNPGWLEIGVQTNGGSGFTTLSPRQPLTPTPYAILAGDVTSANIARVNATNFTETATAVPIINSGFITSVTNISGGAGYYTAPTVTVVDTNGAGAILIASVSGGQVIAISVAFPGSNYSASTTLVISAPSGVSYQSFGGINYFVNASNYFSGNGSGLTSINAANLTAGTITSTLDLSSSSNSFNGTFSGNGSNLTNLNATTLSGLPAAGFWTTNGTAGANPTNGAYLGTADNLPLEIRVNGIRALRLEPTSANVPNIVGGYSVNSSGSNNYGVTIIGGGGPNYPNLASANLATVLGGGGNTASGVGAAVAGIGNKAANACAFAAGTNSLAGGVAALALGNTTVASGNYSSALGINTRAAGAAAQASGTNSFAGGAAAIAWGNNTSASGDFSTAGGNGSHPGGAQSTALGYYTTASGSNAVDIGFGSVASGDYSFAGGDDAQATNTGAFVWADSSVPGIPISSTNAYSVTMRASGGYRLFSNPSSTAGVLLGSNSSSWATISDKNAKKNFSVINGKDILEKLAAIPVEKWNYKWEADDSTPNIGPMAQDFIASFYPGRDDKHITTLEFDGVELAAIQGLNQKLRDELQHKENEINDLKSKNESLAERLDRLEKMVSQINR